MYAHEVLKDMDVLLKKANNKEYQYIFDTWSNLLPSIKNSIKFHSDDGDSLYDLFKKDKGTPIFMDPKYLKLPYKTTWFDFKLSTNKSNGFANPNMAKYGKATNTKEAILVTEVTPTVWITHTFTYYLETNSWMPFYFSIVVFVGGINYGDNRKIYESLCNKMGFNPRSNPEANLFPLAPAVFLGEKIEDLILENNTNYSMLSFYLTLLNCKNIGVTNVNPPSKLNISRKKKGKVELFTYKTLVLNFTNNKHHIGSSVTGEHNRIHLCRGHFKEYTQEHPLFGKVTGLYWWEPHVRGQNKDGVVIKDYSINL